MAQNWIGKLFMLALFTTSDAEALAALGMIKTLLKSRELDAQIIADAMNRVSSSPDEDSCDLDSIFSGSVSEELHQQSYQTDWDREKETQDMEWQAAFHALFQSTDSALNNDTGVEQSTDELLAMTGAKLWPAEPIWQEAAEAAVAEDEVRNAEVAREREAEGERKFAPIANELSVFVHKPVSASLFTTEERV